MLRQRPCSESRSKKTGLSVKSEKKAKLKERKRLEEEVQRKQEEEEFRCREEQRQRDLAHHLEADCVAVIEQQW